jgi:hypothetical protein
MQVRVAASTTYAYILPRNCSVFFPRICRGIGHFQSLYDRAFRWPDRATEIRLAVPVMPGAMRAAVLGAMMLMVRPPVVSHAMVSPRRGFGETGREK